MYARIAPAEPPYDERVSEDLGKLMPGGMASIRLFRVLAKNPRVLRRIRRGGLLDPGSISVRQRELVILRTTARAGAEYEWGIHATVFAGEAGFDSRALQATVQLGPDADCWTDDEKLIVRACDELHEAATLSDVTWTGLRTHFSEPQLIEILVLAGLYRAISYVVRGAGVELEDAAPRFPAMPAPQERIVHRGSCLCGGVRFVLTGELGPFGYCHCRSCRKASGSAHAANAPIDRARFSLVEGWRSVREHESSPGKVRAFCLTCGSPLYAYLRSSPCVLRIRLGTLDTAFTERPRAHTFVSEKADWEPIGDALPQFPEWAPRSVLDQRGSRQPGHPLAGA